MQQAAPLTVTAPASVTSDVDEFQMPMAGFFADLELGTASVRLPTEFVHGSALVQLRVLDAWQRTLARYRRSALAQFAVELARGAPVLDEAGRRELLRSTCESLSIDVPSDFDKLTLPG